MNCVSVADMPRLRNAVYDELGASVDHTVV